MPDELLFDERFEQIERDIEQACIIPRRKRRNKAGIHLHASLEALQRDLEAAHETAYTDRMIIAVQRLLTGVFGMTPPR